MKIQNHENLCKTKKMRHVIDILEQGLLAADPANIIHKFVENNKIHTDNETIDLSQYDATYIAAFGKAAYGMSVAVRRILHIKSGIIVIPQNSGQIRQSRNFPIYRAGHPYPDRQSVTAAKALVKFLSNRGKNDFVLFLISGGASSLLALPDGVTLQDKTRTTDVLLRCGANITEINCVRKHLSRIKGGRLVDNIICQGASLVMSDVEGDDPETIGSGATYSDSTTFDDALSIIKKYGLTDAIPPSVLTRLNDGVHGYISETPNEPSMPYQIIANNNTCLKAMKERAIILGYNTKLVQNYGDVKDVANMLAGRKIDKGECTIFGGEPTVHVTGSGHGGRNQELVLRIMQQIRPGTVVASMGTDGIDGDTKNAGAIHHIVEGDHAGLEPYLVNNDSGSYFEKYGNPIRTGHTHTNLQDIGAIIR